jgi:RHS repeat-associated protein
LRALTVENRIRSRCTGKERDPETGLDYFGARYYSNAHSRWIIPDAVNVTDERAISPSNTLNKYIYGGNNPLKYVDPDGRDITIFYTETGSAGHFWLAAADPSTGQGAVMDFGPLKYGDARDEAVEAMEVQGLPVPGDTNYGNHMLSLDEVRRDYASLTIQTSPEDTQKAVQAIKDFNAGNHMYILFGNGISSANNCTTVCRDVLNKILKINNSRIKPKSLWEDLYKKWGQGGKVPDPPQHNKDYGNPRYRTDSFSIGWSLLRPTPPTRPTPPKPHGKVRICGVGTADKKGHCPH